MSSYVLSNVERLLCLVLSYPVYISNAPLKNSSFIGLSERIKLLLTKSLVKFNQILFQFHQSQIFFDAFRFHFVSQTSSKIITSKHFKKMQLTFFLNKS